jgi:nucleotide-binding universal stress UspA family protein
MKQILVPTDFSECAENAIDFAVHSAKILPGEITLLHSFEVNNNMYNDYMGVNRQFNLTMLNDVKEKLEQRKKDFEETDGVVADTIVSTDSLNNTIANSAVSKKFDLIVMGTLGASGIKEKLWGSRTAAVIGKATVPVMAIPINYTWKKPQKILFATNQFEKDPAILDYIFELADLYMASIQVAVFTDEDEDKAGTFLDHTNRIDEYGKFLRKAYNEETLTSAHLYGKNFDEVLQDFIKENNIDILIMVTYPHGFWNRLFNPSKTKRMSYHTTIPLLAIQAVEDDSK